MNASIDSCVVYVICDGLQISVMQNYLRNSRVRQGDRYTRAPEDSLRDHTRSIAARSMCRWITRKRWRCDERCKRRVRIGVRITVCASAADRSHWTPTHVVVFGFHGGNQAVANGHVYECKGTSLLRERTSLDSTQLLHH